jgi:isoleucyl-tRNA synthetase
MQIFALGKSARESLKSVSDIIAEELNIKRINILEAEPDVITLTAKPNFSLLGPKLGKKLNKTAEIIKTLTTEELKKFKKERKISLTIDEETIVLEQSDLDIKEVEKEGWVKEEDSSFKVVLNTSLTEELKDEGFARELVNKIQNMRKSAGFEVTDRIKIDILTTARVKKALSSYEEYVKKETLAKAIEQKGEKGEFSQVWDINGEKAEISIKRV